MQEDMLLSQQLVFGTILGSTLMLGLFSMHCVWCAVTVRGCLREIVQKSIVVFDYVEHFLNKFRACVMHVCLCVVPPPIYISINSMHKHPHMHSSQAYSSPSIMAVQRMRNGSVMVADDFREAYWWDRGGVICLATMGVEC